MPSQLVRNIQAGLSIAGQFQDIDRRQFEIEEQQRLAMERQQLDGALKSMAETGGIIPDDMKKEMSPRVTMKAQKMFLDDRLESLQSERGIREEEYLRMTDEFLNEIKTSGIIPDTVEGIFGMFNRFEQNEKYPFTVQVMAAQKTMEFLENDVQMRHILDKWQFTQATAEHENFIKSMTKADQFALQGRFDEAVDLVKNTINHTSTPYSLEEQEDGNFTIKFDNPLDGDESQILYENLSFDEVITEAKKLKLEQYYPLVKARREQIVKWNIDALQNPERLYDNNLNEYKIFSFKNPETGEMDVAVETPNGNQITNNEGEVLSFSSNMEARSFLKQHKVDGVKTTGLWNDPKIAYRSNPVGTSKQKGLSIVNSERIMKAITDAVGVDLDEVSKRKLSAQVASKIDDEKMEFNEAVVEVLSQYILSQASKTGETKEQTWLRYFNPLYTHSQVGLKFAEKVGGMLGIDTSVVTQYLEGRKKPKGGEVADITEVDQTGTPVVEEEEEEEISPYDSNWENW